MCRDQNLISETDERTYVRTYGRTYGRTYELMKIEKPVLGLPFLGPAKIIDQEVFNLDPLNYKTLIKDSLLVHKDLLKPQDYLKTNKLNNTQVCFLI